MIKIEQLYYLMQIAKYHSVNKVAEKLYMSSASISTAIKQLEKECGYEIIERTYRGVKLTEKGKQVAKLAEQIFSLYDEIIDLGKEDGRFVEKPVLAVERQVLKLLKNKIINPRTKVLQYFDLKEVPSFKSDYYDELNSSSLMLILLSNSNRDMFESDDRIIIRYLFASKIYPISNKNTKWIKPNCVALSREEYKKLPKVRMRYPFHSEMENVVLETDDSLIYEEAIINDLGVGTILKFTPDIYGSDSGQIKIYEPFDEDVYIAMITKKENGRDVLELLLSLLK